MHKLSNICMHSLCGTLIPRKIGNNSVSVQKIVFVEDVMTFYIRCKWAFVNIMFVSTLQYNIRSYKYFQSFYWFHILETNKVAEQQDLTTQKRFLCLLSAWCCQLRLTLSHLSSLSIIAADHLHCVSNITTMCSSSINVDGKHKKWASEWWFNSPLAPKSYILQERCGL